MSGSSQIWIPYKQSIQVTLCPCSRVLIKRPGAEFCEGSGGLSPGLPPENCCPACLREVLTPLPNCLLDAQE